MHRALVASNADGSTLAHIDPYDPRSVGPGGQSALDLARELIARRVGVVYWYGYDGPERQRWAFDELAAGGQQAIWCGDMMVTAPATVLVPGGLGVATTPGTGFGIVCATIAAAAVDACRRLGDELAAAYDGVPLCDGRRGPPRLVS